MRKNVTLLLCIIFMMMGQASGQTVEPLHPDEKKSVEVTKSATEALAKKADESKLVFRKAVYARDEKLVESRDLEIGVEHFFESKVKNCRAKLCFDFVPTPIVYFQSRSNHTQFLITTTGDTTVAIIRFRF